MPNEQRDIRFSKDELAAVASHYLTLTGHPMAAYKPQHIVVGYEPSRALRVIFMRNAASDLGNVDFDMRDLKDALICYCRDNGYSISRDAQTQVRAFGDEIVMTVRRSGQKTGLKIA